MPRYSYKAKSLQGEEKSGVLEAANRHQLAQQLKAKGYFLVSTVSVEEEREKQPWLKVWLQKIQEMFGVSFKDKLFFTRNLQVMVRTGVPLSRAIRTLSQQTKSKKFQQILKKIAGQIVKGRALSEAFAQFPAVFPVIYTETLKVGEETGKLEESLGMLSEQMEKTYNLRSQIKSAMIYPVVVLSITVLIGILMMILVVPNLKKTFSEMDIALPLTTRIILGSVDFMVENWVTAILLVLVLVGIIVYGLYSKRTNKARSKISLHLPIISSITKQTNSALVLRTLAALSGAGVPVVRALNVSAGSLKNFYFKQSLVRASEAVKKGEKLSRALRPYEKIYSPLVLEMMAVGEETGETTSILQKLADFYESEATSAIERLASVIEPFLILFIGGVVGFFAVSMMQPMFSIMSGL